MTALPLPGFTGHDWTVRGKSDPAALALADRHYSRRTPGSNQLGAPGRKLVFVTADELAVWVTHWPDPALAFDHLDAWRCTMFRNEGPALSSELIVAAMRLTAERWETPPLDRWITWVDVAKISSRNPGYCLKRAGWVRDREWKPRRTLIRLRHAGMVL